MDTDHRRVRRVSTCALLLLLPLLVLASTTSTLLAAEAPAGPPDQGLSTSATPAAALLAPPVLPSTDPSTDPATDPAIRLTDPVAGASLSTRTSTTAEPGALPTAALQAYLFATRMIDAADPACGLDWSLLAAIGSVESDHGRTGGAVLGTDGVSSARIRGVRLDGAGPVARVPDTDAGALDGDARYDRALGPMQFLPATWAAVGVDADGDGLRDVHDLDDAALAAAVYLCAGPGTLSTPEGLRAALLRYNPSDSYVATVTARAAAYGALGPSSTTPTLSARPASTGTATTATTGTPGKNPGKHPGKHPGTKTRWNQADTTVTATLGAQEPNEIAAPPEPTPVAPPSDPEPTDPEPQPEPEPEPELTGTLAPCGEDWCLDEQVLDVGDRAFRAAGATADLDADGALETNEAELEGLAGSTVVLGVARTEAGPDAAAPLVLSVNGLAYRSV